MLSRHAFLHIRHTLNFSPFLVRERYRHSHGDNGSRWDCGRANRRKNGRSYRQVCNGRSWIHYYDSGVCSPIPFVVSRPSYRFAGRLGSGNGDNLVSTLDPDGRGPSKAAGNNFVAFQRGAVLWICARSARLCPDVCVLGNSLDLLFEYHSGHWRFDCDVAREGESSWTLRFGVPVSEYLMKLDARVVI